MIMDNEEKQSYLKLDKNELKNFFKEFIEETRISTENKTQTILSLLYSVKEETEQKISKSNYFLNYKFYFIYSFIILRKNKCKYKYKSKFKLNKFFFKKYI